MNHFAAIDFETANEQPSSVCSVGIVIVRYGIPEQTIYRLIRPEPDYYLYRNTMIHGLNARDTENARVFSHVWKEIDPYIGDLPLVAHNAQFDEGCLKAAFFTYCMDYPDYKFLCTLRASRRHFGKSLPNHQLPTVAAACGHALTNHHNALDDAMACAAIALKIL
ncbi:MAG: 3'-5' exonuclease [Bacteroidales bacterium]|jgi:DNA polymerase-3 subunit epsilon|nr:3'-5' exonuclease [Bacteroidales bacterium]NLH24285.1 3'-5' exonuclease [Bacteroidales bacterium]HPJ82461.1 3'-5' exonuclease [Bacteroidales bacterium]